MALSPAGFTALVTVLVLVAVACGKSPAKAPAQWKQKIAAGSFLYEAREPKNFEMMTSGSSLDTHRVSECVFAFCALRLPLTLPSPFSLP